MGSADARDALNSHTGLLAGAGHSQDGAAWTQSWFNQLKVALLGVQPQLTAVLSPHTGKAFSSAVGSEG